MWVAGWGTAGEAIRREVIVGNKHFGGNIANAVDRHGGHHFITFVVWLIKPLSSRGFETSQGLCG